MSDPTPREHASDANPDATILDGWDSCIVGMTHDGCCVYDRARMVLKMSQETDCSFEEACEYISYNVEGVLPSIIDFPPVIFTPFPI